MTTRAHLAATFATLGATVGAGFSVVWPAGDVAAVAGVAFVVVVGYGLARMESQTEDLDG